MIGERGMRLDPRIRVQPLPGCQVDIKEGVDSSVQSLDSRVQRRWYVSCACGWEPRLVLRSLEQALGEAEDHLRQLDTERNTDGSRLETDAP